MGTIAIVGEVNRCHRCGEVAILDGHGRCLSCYDSEIEQWIPPTSSSIKRTYANGLRRREWDRKYYETHKEQCKRSNVKCQRLRRLLHPELIIKDRERHRQDALKSLHPCLDCGKPCRKESLRCRSCYYKLLRGNFNPWRQQRYKLIVFPNSTHLNYSTPNIDYKNIPPQINTAKQ